MKEFMNERINKLIKINEWLTMLKKYIYKSKKWIQEKYKLMKELKYVKETETELIFKKNEGMRKESEKQEKKKTNASKKEWNKKSRKIKTNKKKWNE